MTSGAFPERGEQVPAGAGTVIEVAGVAKVFRTKSASVRALEDVTFSVGSNQFISILGPSGCGKSTLLRIVAGLETPTRGRVAVEGKEVKSPQTQLGVVFQSPLLLQWRTALGNVLLQAEARKMDRRTAEAKARQLIDLVGLTGSEERLPHQLSGGMQQRVAICRALLHDPNILLMDEPFGALDALTRDQMNVDLLQLWERGRKTVLFVTHSIPEAVFLSDRVIVMSPGPGRIDFDLPIDLPRPRRLKVRETRQFSLYVREIRGVLEAWGILQEEAEEEGEAPPPAAEPSQETR